MSSTRGVSPMACSRFILPDLRPGRVHSWRRRAPAARRRWRPRRRRREASTQRRSTSSGSSPSRPTPAVSMGWHEASPIIAAPSTMASASWSISTPSGAFSASHPSRRRSGRRGASASRLSGARPSISARSMSSSDVRPSDRAWVRTSRSAPSEVPASASGLPIALMASPSDEQDRGDHLALGAEVPVHQGVVDAGGGGHPAHAHAVHAVGREELARRRQDQPAA